MLIFICPGSLMLPHLGILFSEKISKLNQQKKLNLQGLGAQVSYSSLKGSLPSFRSHLKTLSGCPTLSSQAIRLEDFQGTRHRELR